MEFAAGLPGIFPRLYTPEKAMPRIQGQPIPALFPEGGAVSVMLFGEAPGPRGADQSGIPFWGDGAGITVYRVLAAMGRADVPDAAWEDWDGARFKALGLVPRLHGTALSNAYPACPTKDGDHFHAPSNRDLLAPANLARLSAELARAAEGRTSPLRVVAFGKRAEWVLGWQTSSSAVDPSARFAGSADR